MPNDDKFVTLEDLKAAIDAKAGVTSVNNQTGAVSITPANIGAMPCSALPVDLNSASADVIQTGYNVYTNAPEQSGSFAISLPLGQTAKLQFWVGYGYTDSVYIRAYNGLSWQSWKRIPIE